MRAALAMLALAAACGPGTPPAPSPPATSPPVVTNDVAPDAGATPDPGPCPDPAACVAEGEALLADRTAEQSTRALELFTAACERDHARGCEAAAEVLQDHAYYSVPEDDRRAAVLWDRACELGWAHACFRYGFYLWEGLMGAVVIDGRVHPYRWDEHRPLGIPLMQRGCDGGVARACELLDELRAAGQIP